ncbi:Adenylate cyclase, class 3 [Oceanospirillum multiglobuliferum]|uniref:Guanylate cyclase domain-containing protein n=1 Tax=Oceanospirillum multiglobuliferum TaxID=64969 RepID=A0A1T4MVB3_9GAMM|nr:adenylate/guanylate cyclase domain-containing protein [Oceanospirillum multiglobuliferum]OPX56884.1 hypothetical protein BTE48_00150 [Oceanospirillum multiglobuliferum]SJZ70715.1 Adenylate cyclase, class 3 [Oceanospirillum multiglobuliferum]
MQPDQTDDQKNAPMLSQQESSSLQNYLLSHHTTVLTVMFTDIKGYTELSEQQAEDYVTALRKAHDQLLINIIETDKAGLVVKHIGDSVMAVFAEPSVAVERAINIQRGIIEFNQQNKQWQDIEVRIGLHMGQVTVEGQVTQDIFGRHVNRAARIESLADGGQIYLSYTVFDSAKGWLSHQQHYGWHSHGYYRLKGIDEPIEIFEVWDKSQRDPIPPLNSKPIKSTPRTIFLAVALLAGVAIALVAMQFKKVDAWLAQPYPNNLMINAFDQVQLDGGVEDKTRRLANELDAGVHTLFYPTAPNTIGYAEVEISRGENILQPKFRSISLPKASLSLSAENGKSASLSKTLDWQYQSLNSRGELTEQKMQLALTLSSKIDNGDSSFAQHNLSWTFSAPDLESKSGEPLEGEQQFKHQVQGAKAVHKEQVLLSLEQHHFILKTALINQSIRMQVLGVFDYKTQKK